MGSVIYGEIHVLFQDMSFEIHAFLESIVVVVISKRYNTYKLSVYNFKKNWNWWIQ